MTKGASRSPLAGMKTSDARRLSRYLSAKAIDDKPDRQGRILVPTSLREFAGINGEAMMVGAFSRIEVWNAERYNAEDAELEKSAPEISEHIGAILQRV